MGSNIMNSAFKDSIQREFERVIKKSPPLFDEVLLKLASHHRLRPDEINILKKDVLFAVLLVLMIENGFRPKLSDGGVLEDVGDIDNECLKQWKQQIGPYEADFAVIFCEISTKLMMIPLSKTVLVNVVINGMESEVYSVCLPIEQFIILTMQETTFANLFRNLQQLSDTFKNKVLSPIKSKLLGLCGYPGASLMGMPEDLFLKIAFYLPVSDIISLCKTCKTFKQMLDDNNFWHKMFLRDFNSLNTNEEANVKLFVKKTNNWKSLYKEYYVNYEHIKMKHECKKRVSNIKDLVQFCTAELLNITTQNLARLHGVIL